MDKELVDHHLRVALIWLRRQGVPVSMSAGRANANAALRLGLAIEELRRA